MNYLIYKARELNLNFRKLEFNMMYNAFLNKPPFKYFISILGGTEMVQEDIVDNGPNGHCGGREAPGDTTGVVEEVYPMQEVRRSGRVRKTNVKLDPDTWDLGCVQCGKRR